MNKIVISLILFFAAFVMADYAEATIDANDRVYLVSQHVQSGEFYIERAPMIGCFGLPQGPRLVQFTEPYRAPSNIGCGGIKTLVNINRLSCASVVSAQESNDYLSFSKITLDISKCRHKRNADYLATVRKAARMNFPQSDPTKAVELILIK